MMLKFKFNVLPLVFWAFALSAILPAQQLYLRNYSLENGLPSSQVWSVFQDHRGYIWFGTTSGVSRYNGREFKTFTSTDGLSDNEVRSIAEDKQGNIWLGTGNGVTRYDGNFFINYQEKDGLGKGTATKILVAQDGTLWCATEEGGVSHFDGQVWQTFDSRHGLPTNRALSLFQDRVGRIWIGTSKGLSLYAQGEFKNFSKSDGLPSEVICSIGEDAQGNLWVGMENSWISKRSERGFKTYQITGKNLKVDVTAIKKDSLGQLWVATRGAGIYKWNGSTFTSYRNANGLKSETIFDLYQDKEDNLWLATGAGAAKIMSVMNEQFLNYTSREGLLDEVVYCLFRDHKGLFWMGTSKGVSYWDGTKFKHYTTADGLVGSRVWSIAEDRQKRLWFGTEAGASLFDGEHFQNFTEKEGLSVGTRNYAIYVDHHDNVWFATRLGLYKWNGKKFTLFTTKDGLPHNVVREIYPDGKGGMWLGTRGGLSHFDGVRFRNYTTHHGLANNVVWCIASDRQGLLWIGTDAGMSRFDGEVFTNYSTADGLANNVIWFIMPDHAGRLWIGSNGGVDLFYPLLPNKNKVLKHLERATGLVGSEAVTQHGVLEDNDGTLWFALLGGVTHYFPQLDSKNEIAPPIRIEQFRVNDEDLLEREPFDSSLQSKSSSILVVPYDKNDIGFRFAGLSFKDEKDVQYSFQLEGFDKTWSEETRRAEVRYLNLNPGTYTFKVKARNRDGLWSREPAVLTFRILPPFWRTDWFQGLLLIAISLLGYGVYRWRTYSLKNEKQFLEYKVQERTKKLAQAYEKILELDRLKSQFFSNISHELRTPLTLILGPLEEILNGSFGAIGDAARIEIYKIIHNSRRLLRLINQLLDLSRLESKQVTMAFQLRDLRSFMQDIILAFEPFVRKKKLKLDLDAPSDLPNIYFDPDKMDKIVYNLISNACKFTPSGGSVLVKLRGEADSVTLEVRDTGIGIKSKELPFIFDRFRQADGSFSREYEGSGIGLSLVKELVDLHHGSIECQSEYGKGTTFILRLPRGSVHIRPEELVETDDQTSPNSKGSIELAGLEIIDQPKARAVESNSHEKTVLLADNNPHMRHYLSTVLKSEYNLVVAKNGREALEKLEAQPISLVLSDVMMPQMSGYELVQAIRSNPALSHLPVILLTAKADLDAKLVGLKEGANDYLAKPFNARELKARVKNLLRLNEQELIIKKQNQELQLMNQRLAELSITDPLINVFNRRHFNEILWAEFKRAIRQRDSISLLIADIDEFKKVNDTFGHLVGDKVLDQTAMLLKNNLRPGDIIARFGGEEFIILAPVTDAEGGYRLAERLRQIVAEQSFECLKGRRITLSIGVSTLEPSETESPEELIRQADMSLYAAKAEGRNRVISSRNVHQID